MVGGRVRMACRVDWRVEGVGGGLVLILFRPWRYL